MTRPKKSRIVEQPPTFTQFQPLGISPEVLDPILLSLDEYEAIRFADYMGLDHEEGAKRMEISRPTFTRMVEQARQKIARFLIDGKLLTIEGGTIHFTNNTIKCLRCGRGFKVCFGKTMKNCPACGAEKFLDQASQFGHGPCCRRRGIRKCKEGDNHAR